jgi:hypothetical protein
MRALHDDERPLVQHLFMSAGIPADLEQIQVQSMDDGGMGSLQFSPRETRVFGRVAAECRFVDEDGVPVLAALNLDRDGNPFELDLWKVDFSALRRWPRPEQIRVAEPTKEEI